jgi:hypothetical protein
LQKKNWDQGWERYYSTYIVIRYIEFRTMSIVYIAIHYIEFRTMSIVYVVIRYI